MIVYTFWEPREKIPYYLQLCMETWKKFLPNAEIVLLDYKNIGEYIDIDKDIGSNLLSGRFSLVHIADAIRVALLAKHGGVWVDVDTIILNPNAEKYFLPDEKNRTVFFGTPSRGGIRICFINTPPNAPCMNGWLDYIREKIETLTPSTQITWDFLGNKFIDAYYKTHKDEIQILSMAPTMPELKLISKETGVTYRSCYPLYYFKHNNHLTDVNADLLLLHNSWTPKAYKNFSPENFLRCDCTMTNILAEILELKVPPPMNVFRLILCSKNKLLVSTKKFPSKFGGKFFLRI